MKATKVRIYPTPEQADFLNQQFGAVRFTYNKSLRIISTQYKRHGLKLNAKHDMKKLLPVAKRSRKYGWLSQFDSIALQQACINLDKAFKAFFDPKLKARYPQFKKKHGKQSSYHCMGVSAGENWIKIPKCSQIKARIHRELNGSVKSITISRTKTGKYFASILTNEVVAEKSPVKSIDTIIGLDMGLTHIAIKSDGTKEDNPRFLLKASKNLRRKQKSLSRKQKGSNNRNKARILVAKAHEKTANARQDFQHKLSRTLVDENQAIVVETLKVKNMLKNRRLSKHIADASWSSFIEKLKYKAKSDGKHLVLIDQWYASSKTCSCCGHKMDVMPLNIRTWECPSCHIKHDRDINAAINIRHQGILKLRAEGLSVPANGGLCKTDHESATA